MIGIGEDSHAFGSNKKLVLGGVVFEGEKGLIAQSDGDVVLHSLFNAVSSAVGGRSIGFYFPDKDEKNKNRDSMDFIEKAVEMLKENNCIVENISISIECKKPRIEPKIEEIKKKISSAFSVQPCQVGITATSGEGLTSFGKGEGIRVVSVVSILKK
jgi:2-C-methyl-D-erythritol 2,4-cyclodiphosphate synthase